MQRAHSSAWIEWLPAKQLVEGSSPSEPVTDIVMCPRQRVFKEIDSLPVTDKDLNIFSSGRAVHEAVQSLFNSNQRRFEKEKYVE
jgi:hypothetical protein